VLLVAISLELHARTLVIVVLAIWSVGWVGPAEEWPFTYSGVTPDYSSLEEGAFARGHFLRKLINSGNLYYRN